MSFRFAKRLGLRVPEGGALTPDGLRDYRETYVATMRTYNAGEGNVDKYEGVPPFGETQTYVRNITGRYGKTYHPVLTPEDAAAYFNLLPGTAREVAAK